MAAPERDDEAAAVAFRPNATDRRILWVAVAALLVGVAVHRVVLVAGLVRLGVFLKYPGLAEAIVSGRLPVDRLTDVSPLYLWLITGARFVAGLTPRAMVVLQGGGVVLAAFLAAMLARRYGGVAAGALTFGFVMLNRAAFVNAAELEPETLVLLLNTVALFSLLRPSPDRRRLALGGVALGLSALTKPTGLATIALLGLWLARRERRKPGRPLLLFVIAAAIPILAGMGVNGAITGAPILTDPGTVFYEGMNPHATGYGSAEPVVVSDLRSTVSDLDAVHVAYRIVASRAEGETLSPRQSNRFWTGKALAFAAGEPLEAARLVLRKGWFLFHAHDAWDVSTMALKARALDRKGWLPFGLLAALSLAALVSKERRDVVIPLLLYVAAQAVAPLLFYVTSRQRSPLLPAVAILAALGVMQLVSVMRARRWFEAFLTLGVVASVAMLLVVDRAPQEEDEYLSVSAFASERAVRDGATASPAEALRMRAIDATWLSGEDPQLSEVEGTAIAQEAAAVLRTDPPDSRVFDVALALLRTGQWSEADRLLARLQERRYRPERDALATGSVAWYRAVAMFALGKPVEGMGQLERASMEAPGDPDVLALEAALGRSPDASERLASYHDPFTADLAVARARLILGHAEEATVRLAALERSIPEWSRPARLRASFTRGTVGPPMQD